VTDRYPVEALLRPPVELHCAAVAMSSGLLALAMPGALMMTPSVAQATAVGFFALALVRFRAGLRVVRYQRNLRRLPHYELPATKIPVSTTRLFLGRGFQWTQRHTQRLRDTLRPEVRRYLGPGRVYRLARFIEARCAEVRGLRLVARALGSRSVLNLWAPLAPVGGRTTLHGVGETEQSVFVPLGERVGHMLVLGTTRVGKTRLGEILITQDIQRGDVVIVLDPKGDPDLLKRCYCEAKRAGRLNAFYALHLGFPEWSARYNAIGSFERETEVASRVARQLPSAGNSAAFREFSWRFVNIVARALIAMGQRPDYRLLLQHVTHIEPLFVEYCRHWLPARRPNWEADVAEVERSLSDRNVEHSFRGRDKRAVAFLKYLEQQQLYDPILDGLRSAVRYDKTYFDKIVASLLPLLEKLTTGKVAELIAPDYANKEDPRPIFDWYGVIRQKGIVYVGLDALADQDVATAVGNSMFADLVSVCGKLYKHGTEHDSPEPRTYRLPTISLHADEFNELIGDEFIPLINKGGGAGMQVTAYTQTWSDLEARLESRAKAGQVIGNFNTLVMFRVKELATAELLTEQLPIVETNELMLVSSSRDSSDPDSDVDFVSSSEDRISVSRGPMIAPSDIVALPKGQAFVFMEGGQLWKVRMPLPAKERDPSLPQDLKAMAQAMRQTYSTAEHWWSEYRA
jgi:conjugative coupling factor TraD (TOL family)